MKLYGLIGYPLSHSFSTKYFAEKFERERIKDCQYQPFPIESIEMLPGLIRQFPHLKGLNVTIPYKRSVMSYLQHLDVGAEKIGAVNTIKIVRNHDAVILSGYNTDSYGFLESLRPHLQQHHSQALIIGTGGASKAVAYVLEQLGIRFTFVSRTPSGMNQISYEDMTHSIISQSRIIINTSPVGMYPNISSYPRIPYEFISAEHLLYDLIYNPEETEFLKRGRIQGAKIVNGLQMLHLQAERAWEIWNAES